MPGARIVALGHHLPARVVTNHDLAQFVDTDDEWIQRRTGIVTRHRAEHETVPDLAVAAARKALASAGTDPAEIDMVVVATCSAMERCPSIAARVAGELGLRAPVCFDLNNACAGFCTALGTAAHAVDAGSARQALVIGAEKMSDVVDWSDRTSCVLLGDGAGAAVVGRGAGIGPVVWGSDTSRRSAVRIENDWRPVFAQDGQAVFRWATTTLAPFAREACERAGVLPSELAGVVTHQANLRIIDHIVAKLGAERAVIARDVVTTGNTSAASVPIAFSKLVESGQIATGEPVLLFGFGGGLSWAGQVVAAP